MKKAANEVGGTRLAIMCIEYMLATQKGQVHEVVKQICKDVGADENGVMKSLKNILVDLKIQEQSKRFSDNPEALVFALDRMVENGYMTKIGDSYKLTVMGQVYAKHQIINDPASREFYRRLLLSNGGNPDLDDLLKEQG